MYVYKSVAKSRVTNAHYIIHSVLTGSRSPAGPRRLGTATRISASLSRRLSASFGSAPDQGPKAAKFAVLTPGHAGFPNRVKRSGGSDTTPTRNTTCFAVWAAVCDLSLKAECVYPLSPMKANVGHLCEKLKDAMKSGLGRSCSGNFLEIFAGTVLGKKPNFTGRFFEWRKPFDFSTR